LDRRRLEIVLLQAVTATVICEALLVKEPHVCAIDFLVPADLAAALFAVCHDGRLLRIW